MELRIISLLSADSSH